MNINSFEILRNLATDTKHTNTTPIVSLEGYKERLTKYLFT